MALRLSSVKRRGNKHSDLHQAGIANFDADLGGTHVRIKNRTDVANAAGQHPIRIGIEPKLGSLTHVDAGEIVFVDIAKNPYR